MAKSNVSTEEIREIVKRQRAAKAARAAAKIHNGSKPR